MFSKYFWVPGEAAGYAGRLLVVLGAAGCLWRLLVMLGRQAGPLALLGDSFLVVHAVVCFRSYLVAS